MSLLFFDGGGEYYDTARIFQAWDSRQAGGPNVEGSNGRRGGALLSYGQLHGTEVSFPEAGTIHVGFAMRFPLAVSQNELMSFKNRSTIHVRIDTAIGGGLRIFRDSNIFLGETGHDLIFADIWHYIELRVVISDTGSVTIRVDGVEVIDLDPVDTQNGSTTTIGSLQINFGTGTVQLELDDLYILDTNGSAPQNTYLGDCQVIALLPTGNGATSDFTPSTGANWENVDENPHSDDTNHNESSTGLDVDLYTYPTIPTITGGSTVVSLKVLAATKRPDSAYSDIELVARPASTNFFSGEFALATDYRYKKFIWDDDPSGGAWTDAKINSAEFGVRKP